jgi:hypothetical protein
LTGLDIATLKSFGSCTSTKAADRTPSKQRQASCLEYLCNAIITGEQEAKTDIFLDNFGRSILPGQRMFEMPVPY